MLFTLPIASVLLASSVSAQSLNITASLENTTNAFTQAKVVPDVLSSFSPVALLNVTFNATQSVNVTPGILLSMEQTATEPQFFFLANQTIPPNTPYVLTIVDPDAPTPQNTSISQFRHFLGGGFTVDNATGLLTNTTAALSDFVPPTPPNGSDPHRYVVLVYLQPDNFDSDASQFVNASTERNNFNLTTFANEVNLGKPFAGTFFFTGPSDNSTSTGSTSGSQPSPTDGNGALSVNRVSIGLVGILGLVSGMLLI